MIQAPNRKNAKTCNQMERHMALENVLESIAASLAAIAIVMQTQSQAVAVLGAPEAPVEKKTRAKKSDATAEVAAVPNEPAVAAPATEVVATPAPTTPAASTVSTPAQKPWGEVLAKVVEVNRSELPSAGRKGVEGILAKFFGADAAGKKVPALEGLNKHNEVFAYAASLLVAPTPADDDLGL